MRDAAWTDRLLLLLGLRSAVLVKGDSMRPALSDNDVVIVASARSVMVGDIVIADHPYKRSVTIVKRVTAIDEDGRCELRGDDALESADSRSFGTIPLDHIRGKVVCRIRQ